MFEPIAGDGNAARFALLREPNGVYCVDGRTIPVRNDAPDSIYDRESVCRVHRPVDDVKRLLGAVLGVHKKQR